MDQLERMGEGVAARLCRQPLTVDESAFTRFLALGLPRNAVTGKAYSGQNILSLWLAQLDAGRASTMWLTRNQALQVGRRVRDGAVAAQCVRLGTGERGVTASSLMGSRTVLSLRRFEVFSVEDLDEPMCGDRWATVEQGETWSTHVQTLVQQSGATVHGGVTKAFYAPHSDTVHMPPITSFSSEAAWARALVMQLAHWTGHRSRLHRRMRAEQKDSIVYAHKELVADLAAAIFCARVGIVAPLECYVNPIGRSVLWLHRHPELLRRVAHDAQAAYALLCRLAGLESHAVAEGRRLTA